MKASARTGLARTFAWPLAIAAATVVALVMGLLGTGWLDALAVGLLSVPALICAWVLLIAGRRSAR